MSEYELPPNDCFNKDVSFESLYGIWPAKVFFFFEPSAKLVITYLKVKRDLLMSMASLAARPVFPVCEERSLPARSTSYNLLVIILSTWLLSIKSTFIVKIA